MIIRKFVKEKYGFFGQDIDSWTRNWNAVNNLVKSSKNAEKDHLSCFFKKYFPKPPKRILQGGCGIGKYVIVYRNLGYDILGVDFSGATIKRIREEMGADFPVYEADITALPFDEGYFDCYYSDGVIEHFQNGPNAPLKEARRVLRREGLLLATVPYINLIRRLRFTIFPRMLEKGFLYEKVDNCKDTTEVYADYRFGEYIFDVKSLKPYFENNGFLIVATYPTDFLWGEIGLLLSKFISKHANRSEYITGNCLEIGRNDGNKDTVRRGSLVRDLAYSFLVTEDRNNIFFKIPLTLLNYLSGHMILFVAKAI